jgi:cytochrome c-type biogenesis protein CcmH/NrfG
MSRITPSLIAIALAIATPTFAQQSEMENYQAGGDALLANHRETTQYSIDRATAALKASDYKTARRFASSVVRADPKRIESWKLLGAAQIGLQDWSGARRSYASAVRITPGDPESRSGLGVAMAYLNDPKAQEQLTWLTARVAACRSNCAALAGYQRQVADSLTAAAGASKTGR